MKIPNLADTEAWSGVGGFREGWNDAKVVEATETISRNGKNTPGINLKVAPVDSDDGKGGIYDTVWITAKAMGRVKQFLEAVGVDTNRELDLNPAGLVGRRCQVHLTRTREDKDDPEKKWLEVQAYRPASVDVEAGGDPLAGAATQTGGGQFAGVGAGSSGEDDIPF